MKCSIAITFRWFLIFLSVADVAFELLTELAIKFLDAR